MAKELAKASWAGPRPVPQHLGRQVLISANIANIANAVVTPGSVIIRLAVHSEPARRAFGCRGAGARI